MRKIDWDKALSEEDIAFLRQMGVQGTEERIAQHQAKFDASVPDEDIPNDELTQSAGDPAARVGQPVETPGGPQLVDPRTQGAADIIDEPDDYDSWKVSELEAEVTARNDMENTTNVEVVGTGASGKVLKDDLIKGLRLWDQENPGAL